MPGNYQSPAIICGAAELSDSFVSQLNDLKFRMTCISKFWLEYLQIVQLEAFSYMGDKLEFFLVLTKEDMKTNLESW